MHKSRERKYSKRRGKHTKGKHTKYKQPIVPTNLPPVEEHEPNNGRLTAEQQNSLRKHIDYLMNMEKSGKRTPTQKQPTKEDLEIAKNGLLEKLGTEMWKEQNMRVPPLDDYFNEHRRSPDPSPSPSPRPIPTKIPDPTPKNELLFDNLRLPDIRDKKPPISGGKSRRIFRRRKMDSRRRKQRSTRKRT